MLSRSFSRFWHNAKILRNSSNVMDSQGQPVLKAADLIAAIAESEGMPPARVRKVLRALSARIGVAIDSGERIQLPGLTFVTRTRPNDQKKIAVIARRSGS